MGLLQTIRFSLQRVRGKPAVQCAHLDQIREVTPSSTGCQQCLELGDNWVHLRMCMTDGLVLCCDSSKNKHARAHYDATTHPIIQSFEPGEDWYWCYVDELFFEVDGEAPSPSHP